MNRKRMVSIVAGILAAIMLLSLILSILPISAHAASSASIKSELDALKDEANKIKKQQKELQEQQNANANETKDIVEQKKEIDQQIKLIHDEITNINAQIQSYNQLIAEKQKELDDAKAEQSALSEQYSVRLRSMEKSSHVSYWSVLFQANSFSEFLSNVRMMADIAKADQAMMEQLEEAADKIATAQEELNTEKQGLNEQRTELADAQAQLDEKAAKATLLLDELNDKAAELQQLQQTYEEKEEELSGDIAAKEKEYTAAVKKEQEQNANSGSSGSSGGSGSSSSGSGWGYPLPYRVTVTSAYGWRIHPTTGKNSFHHGVDLGARSGTPIYASRSGTVTTATYSSVYGYYVTINHGDGYSSLYAHMTHYVVSSGEKVTKGQVIGYVGSTGWSTGAHLHFSVYYNGSSVNPMNYI